MSVVDLSNVSEIVLPTDHVTDYTLLHALNIRDRLSNPIAAQEFKLDFDRLARFESKNYGDPRLEEYEQTRRLMRSRYSIEALTVRVEEGLDRFNCAGPLFIKQVGEDIEQFAGSMLNPDEAERFVKRVQYGYRVDEAAAHDAYIGQVELVLSGMKSKAVEGVETVRNSRNADIIDDTISVVERKVQSIERGLAFREHLIAQGNEGKYRFRVFGEVK